MKEISQFNQASYEQLVDIFPLNYTVTNVWLRSNVESLLSVKDTSRRDKDYILNDQSFQIYCIAYTKQQRVYPGSECI